MRRWLWIFEDGLIIAGESILVTMAWVLIKISGACLWLAQKMLDPGMSRDLEGFLQVDHLRQVIQDDLNGEPWDEGTDLSEYLDEEWLNDEQRTWRMEHDDKKDDR
ncbi:hypothetical protein LCGC14_1972440 [marine sediment metagenome]|uniref:Uncharacterized protein n=1 Tax=marine sediment metagenome TaxID=412755 RepID=A0A0F9FZG7_9ZZZZ